MMAVQFLLVVSITKKYMPVATSSPRSLRQSHPQKWVPAGWLSFTSTFRRSPALS